MFIRKEKHLTDEYVVAYLYLQLICGSTAAITAIFFMFSITYSYLVLKSKSLSPGLELFAHRFLSNRSSDWAKAQTQLRKSRRRLILFGRAWSIVFYGILLYRVDTQSGVCVLCIVCAVYKIMLIFISKK